MNVKLSTIAIVLLVFVASSALVRNYMYMLSAYKSNAEVEAKLIKLAEEAEACSVETADPVKALGNSTRALAIMEMLDTWAGQSAERNKLEAKIQQSHKTISDSFRTLFRHSQV